MLSYRLWPLLAVWLAATSPQLTLVPAPAPPAGFAIAPVYDKVMGFSEGLAPVMKDGEAGYIDRTGRTVLPFIYAEASPFHEGMAFASFLAGYKGLQGIDRTGKVVLKEEFETSPDFREGLAAVQQNKQHEAEANFDGKYGYMNPSGTVVIPYRFNQAYYFSEGLAAVMLNGKWGYIDRTGKLVIAATLEKCARFV